MDLIKSLIYKKLILNILQLLKLFCVAIFDAFDYILSSTWNRKTFFIRLQPVSFMASVFCLIIYQASFKSINYFIISLDIIFLLTTLFLIMYHVFKDPENLLFNN